MRHVITNNEQSGYIRKRLPFGTRKMGYGYVYQGIVTSDGYECWHWNTLIAKFYNDGRVYLEDDHRSVTTNRYRWDIWQAMTPEERQRAAYDIVQREREYARTYPYGNLHASKSWRERLARWESYAYTPERMRAA